MTSNTEMGDVVEYDFKGCIRRGTVERVGKLAVYVSIKNEVKPVMFDKIIIVRKHNEQRVRDRISRSL